MLLFFHFMLIVSLFLFIFSFLHINSLFDSDEIAKKINDYIETNRLPLVLTERIPYDEAGSMSSTYFGYFKLANQSHISVVVKYSSYKSIWNYVHNSEFNHLYERKCRVPLKENQNEYLVLKEDKNRIVQEGWIPSEVYVGFKSYFCARFMPTLTIVKPIYSYFSFFHSIDQTDHDRTFFMIFKKIENGISLKKYLESYSHQLTLQMTKSLIHSILIAIIKLKSMFIIHLDLNLGNIFIMNNDHQHPIRFIDFGIMKFLYSIEQTQVFYSENLHKSLRKIFLNCPSCVSLPTLIFSQNYHEQFKTYSIESLLQHSWFYNH